MKLIRVGVSAAVLAAACGAASADVLSDWKTQYLDTVRAVGGGPMPLSRAAAMYTTAVYDAVNSIDLANTGGVGFQPFRFAGAALAGSSREAAAAQAAHDVLTNLYPARTAIYDSQLASSLAAIAPGAAKTNGINLGAAVAGNCITDRAADGATNNAPYVPGTNAGDWRPTADTPAVPPHAPNWGLCTPYVLSTANQFVPNISGAGHPFSFPNVGAYLASPQYAANVNEVKDFGRDVSASRTADQTQLAWFWANDRDGTYKPPGQLLNISDEVAAQHGVTDLSARARMFAMVGASMGDAGIAAWWTKYQTNIDLWRPMDAVRETQDDGNAATTAIPGWHELNDFTPPFPGYISGHSTFGGAWAAAMAAFFGTDNISFSATTDEFIVNPFLDNTTYPDGLTRSFTSFSQAGLEDALSRIYLGVHFRVDCEDGFTMGQLVGGWAATQAFQAVPTPGSGVMMAFAGMMMASRRRSA